MITNFDKPLREIYEESLRYVNNSNCEFTEQYIKRIMVNHIRHKYTSYNKDIRAINKHRPECFAPYRARVLQCISESYPFLKDECDNQKYTVIMAKPI